MHVQLHVYPVTHDVRKALIVSQAIIYTELKDDRVQIEQAITLFNLGRVAWVPDDLVLDLPEGFTALTGQNAMGGEGIDPVEKRGAKIRGTFGPGQHSIDFRWQLPYDGEANLSFDETLPPNVAVARALAAASQQMRLVVSGFPEAQARMDSNGERILVTERQMRPNDPPLTKLHVELRDLPTPGPGEVSSRRSLAGLGVLAGVGYAFACRGGASRPRAGAKEVRARLLADMEELERAYAAGDVGPKTYERARRELIDAIARTLGHVGEADGIRGSRRDVSPAPPVDYVRPTAPCCTGQPSEGNPWRPVVPGPYRSSPPVRSHARSRSSFREWLKNPCLSPVPTGPIDTTRDLY